MGLHYWKIVNTSGVRKYLPVVLALVALSIVGSFALRTPRADVCVVAPDREIHIRTHAKTVGDVLEAVNVRLYPGDTVDPSPESQVQDGQRIIVNWAVPVFVQSGGQVHTVLTAQKNVEAILKLAGISPGPDDVTHPGLDQDISEDRLIKVVRVTYGEVTENQEVPYETLRKEDRTLEAGLTRVYKTGTPGVEKVTYRVRYEDGVEVSRHEESRVRIKDPSPRIVLVGSLTEVSRGGQNIRFQRALEVTATAYCPCTICCGPNANGYTHTGVKAQKGVIAVDPSVIPLGTRVYVENYGFAVAADTGSAIKGSMIDVCFDTHQEALAWGMRKVKVYILPP